MGLLCSHKIDSIKENQCTLQLDDIDGHWYLHHVQILPPWQPAPFPLLSPMVLRPLGRPPGALGRQPASSPRRDPSAFERATRQLGQRATTVLEDIGAERGEEEEALEEDDEGAGGNATEEDEDEEEDKEEDEDEEEEIVQLRFLARLRERTRAAVT
ncbi:MAG: hypothetical protein M1829_002686 [Trizodia sp. TS-e1964]|nr:MAG: hypothetical protein M1829_002686 [Trizodia sp. TS-e1964]